MSQVQKLKQMIIRIGDERREAKDDHLLKLKNQFVSPFVLKEKNHRMTLTHTLLTCIQCMPHKVNLYSSLICLVAVDDFDFASEILANAVESLSEVFIQEGEAFRCKNIMRLLGNLVQIGLITSEALCQFLIQIMEDY